LSQDAEVFEVHVKSRLASNRCHGWANRLADKAATNSMEHALRRRGILEARDAEAHHLPGRPMPITEVNRAVLCTSAERGPSVQDRDGGSALSASQPEAGAEQGNMAGS
jgi:hypothetical protein